MSVLPLLLPGLWCSIRLILLNRAALSSFMLSLVIALSYFQMASKHSSRVIVSFNWQLATGTAYLSSIIESRNKSISVFSLSSLPSSFNLSKIRWNRWYSYLLLLRALISKPIIWFSTLWQFLLTWRTLHTRRLIMPATHRVRWRCSKTFSQHVLPHHCWLQIVIGKIFFDCPPYFVGWVWNLPICIENIHELLLYSRYALWMKSNDLNAHWTCWSTCSLIL